jgi:hypothetical protein
MARGNRARAGGTNEAGTAVGRDRQQTAAGYTTFDQKFRNQEHAQCGALGRGEQSGDGKHVAELVLVEGEVQRVHGEMHRPMLSRIAAELKIGIEGVQQVGARVALGKVSLREGGWMNGRLNEWMDGWMDGWMEWMDEWNGWMNGMDGWMDEWMDGLKQLKKKKKYTPKNVNP